MEENALYIIDGHSMIYRAYYALIKRPLINSKGMNTSAIYGFLRMLFRLIKSFSPKYLLISFDTGKKNFRHDMFKPYKENRKEMPDDLITQIPVLKKIIDLLGVRQVEVDGYESDDVIAKIAKDYAKKGLSVYIVSKDKDLLQLVNDRIKMMQMETTRAKEEFLIMDDEKVQEKFQVAPADMVDFLSLTGDTSDNIPGVSGIGPVGAVKLINQYHNLENIYKNIDRIEPVSLREKLQKDKKKAFLSRDLIKLVSDMPFTIEKKDMELDQPRKEEILKIFDDLEIKTLLKELDWFEGITTETTEKDYTIIDTKADLEKLIKQLKENPQFVIDTETDEVDPMKASLVGISASFQAKKAYYIPIGHTGLMVRKQLAKEYVIEKLQPVLQKSRIIGQNLKYDYIVLKREGLLIQNLFFDTMLASYLLNPTKTRHNLDEMALQFLGYKMITYKELLGKDYRKKSFAEVPIKEASDYSCEDSDITFRLYELLEKKLDDLGLKDLYYKIDIPLLNVLCDMEMAGVRIDPGQMRQLDKFATERIQKLTEEIYSQAGETFNINSTKQLANVLFDKLKLPSFRKGKTGKSTDVDVLEQLKKHHPIAQLLLEYRSMNKLKTTYIDVLPRMINQKTGRIHTSFSQTTTATGRLASSDPNLQNIPIRDEFGKKIREAFVPEKNNWLLSADYSQIELRILAHIAEDKVLIDAFNKGEDIHNRTVMEIYGVPPQDVTPDLRRMAKVINYGVAYGMSAYGLSQGLDISVQEADDFINRYFTRYKGIKEYIERTKKEIEKKGFVENLFNRRRYLPDMKNLTKQQKNFISRTAINTPIQGSAADLIKLAMIDIHDTFVKENLKSRMILQVHDELVFEVVPAEKDKVFHLVKDKMEKAVKLKVPLAVDIHFGKNWSEAH